MSPRSVDCDISIASLRKEFPHIIYAHLSAWGKHGELASKGGFDIGAFWSFSGMAAMTMEKERFRYYAGGSGDLTTGQMLLSGINMALYQRLETGLGCNVEVSLMHVGAWCISPFIVRDQYQNVSDQQPPDYQNKPQASMVDTFYETRDHKHVAVCYKGSFLDERKATCELCVALGLSCNESTGTPYHDKETVQRVVGTLSLEELQRRLKGCSCLDVHPYVGLKDKWEQIKSEMYSHKEKVEPVVDEVSALGVTDLPFLPRLPYEFSCADNHGPVRRAPQMAEHTDCILQNGWLAAPDAPPLLPSHPRPNTTQRSAQLPLDGVVVIELADLLAKHDVCIPAVASMLAAKGATVYRYEPSTGDPLKAVDSDTYSLFNGNKAVIELSDVRSLLEMADVVLTDFSLEKLCELGLDYATLIEKHSSVVYVHLKDGRDQSAVGALASGYVRSGFANIYAGSTAIDIPTLPTHTLELMSSAFIFASTTAALFRKRRLQNAGQEVIVTYERLGLFILQGISVLMLRDPSIIRLLGNKMSTDNPHPVPSLVAHRTKDGMWIQLLETDFKKGILSLANALEIKHRLLRAVAWGISVGVIPKYIQSSNALPVDELAGPAFVAINGLVKSCIAEYNFSDVKKRFEEHNLSYTTVKMPAQLINCDQYHANGVFKEATCKKLPHRKHYHVTVPVSVSD